MILLKKGSTTLEFYQTGMGKTFFERTMPELVAQLKQLNAHMAQLIQLDENIKENQKSKTEPKDKAW
jgi:hypothetical protein